MKTTMRILYFAWLSTEIGLSEENVLVPTWVDNVTKLLAWLKTRTPGHESALSDLSAIQVAVNQVHTCFNHPVTSVDEVAFFPPVTGG